MSDAGIAEIMDLDIVKKVCRDDQCMCFEGNSVIRKDVSDNDTHIVLTSASTWLLATSFIAPGLPEGDYPRPPSARCGCSILGKWQSAIVTFLPGTDNRQSSPFENFSAANIYWTWQRTRKVSSLHLASTLQIKNGANLSQNNSPWPSDTLRPPRLAAGVAPADLGSPLLREPCFC